MKFKILLIDQKTGNGQLHPLPTQVIEAAIRQAEPRVKARTLTVHSKLPASLNNCVGIVNKLELKKGHVLAEIEFLPHATSRQVKIGASSGKVSFSADGIGQVDAGGSVTDYQITAIVAESRSKEHEARRDQSPAH